MHIFYIIVEVYTVSTTEVKFLEVRYTIFIQVVQHSSCSQNTFVYKLKSIRLCEFNFEKVISEICAWVGKMSLS